MWGSGGWVRGGGGVVDVEKSFFLNPLFVTCLSSINKIYKIFWTIFSAFLSQAGRNAGEERFTIVIVISEEVNSDDLYSSCYINAFVFKKKQKKNKNVFVAGGADL